MVATLLNILTPELLAGLPQFLATCQTYEGGFGNASFPGWAFGSGRGRSQRAFADLFFTSRFQMTQRLRRLLPTQATRRRLARPSAKPTEGTHSAQRRRGCSCSHTLNPIVLPRPGVGFPNRRSMPVPFFVGACKCRVSRSSSGDSKAGRTSSWTDATAGGSVDVSSSQSHCSVLPGRMTPLA